MKRDLRQFGPLTDSLDLVRGSADEVVTAVRAEFQRYTNDTNISLDSVHFSSVAEVLESVQTFANVPLTCFVLPTNSPWTVLWFDCFLFSGYSSLCFNLTRLYNFETMHWESSDKDSKMLRGTSFSHCRKVGTKVAERKVYCAMGDAGHWEFWEYGEPIPAEDLTTYKSKRKPDRLNENLMADLLSRLGAFPMSSEFYALPQKPAYVVRRVSWPATVITKSRREALELPSRNVRGSRASP